MSKKIVVILLICVISTVTLLTIHFWPKLKNNPNPTPHPKPGEFKGLCMFDVDHTLSTGQHNHDVVQTCLDAGFAVGVSTAGSHWTPDTLIKQPWFPHNLYNFMKNRDFDTMNNVVGDILEGKKNTAAFEKIDKSLPAGISPHGWRKGFVLQENSKNLGITNPGCIIMFDDSRDYIAGIHAYNKDYNIVCSGADCGGKLHVDVTQKAIQKCKT